MRRPEVWIRPLILLTILITAAAGCSRTESETDAQQTAPESGVEGAVDRPNDEVGPEPEAPGNRTITLAPAAEAAADEPGDDIQAASRRARNRDFVVAAKPGDGSLPEENAIGALADRFSDNADRRAIYRVVEAFLQAVSEGRLPADSILPSERTGMKRTLDLALENRNLPTDFAIGTITILDEGGRMNVALYGDPGWTAGEVSVAAQDGRWYISDIQIDFTTLAVAPTEVERFEPVSYDWQIHSR